MRAHHRAESRGDPDRGYSDQLLVESAHGLLLPKSKRCAQSQCIVASRLSAIVEVSVSRICFSVARTFGCVSSAAFFDRAQLKDAIVEGV
jgi:hypothetical protein